MKESPRILTWALIEEISPGIFEPWEKRHASVEVSVVYFVARDGCLILL